ncbi:MAG: class I SAM-dependent DNA methyltransferase [Burkholderiaceae bacterium]|nr:class I SAM-dependent DNA methyltransferase [Burkholderiaceae bacterium]
METPSSKSHPVTASDFIARWQGVTASELSTAQSFVRELCELLDVGSPHATREQDYMFERPVTFAHGDGTASFGRIDCYRRGSFVLEAKKVKHGVSSKGFDDALLRARAQAEGYARALPAEEGRPPFLLVVDVGNVIELYAEFSRSGATYTPFPDPRNHRIALADLARAEVRATLRAIWLAPDQLNPALASARVTREVSAQLAGLARSLEASGHRADQVGAFLTRCLFSMFAEDVELLPKGSFLALLQQHGHDPQALQHMLRALWADMDQGGFCTALARQVLRFNGKLFKEPASDGYSLLLNQEQVALLAAAAKSNWREVEPAIFGTLLERALSTDERHALGAHYTPRAYVERLVLPTIIEPLRADWADVQAAAVLLAQEAAEMEANPPVAKTGSTFETFDRQTARADLMAMERHEAAVRAKWREARDQVRAFHHALCNIQVLDPACGSGNFLYVTLEHLKRLEGEVINQLMQFGGQEGVEGTGETVTLQQLRGIEINARAAALAELVLWFGYLQWHIRTRGNKAVAEPVVHDYGNIECRDAVLAWDDLEPAYDADGQLLTRWDGKTFKTHPTTGRRVPDDNALVPQWRYIRPRKATWPQADFIVGNPPFIGAAPMREALGDGYVETLRAVWKDVPESADFVMYWWREAAALVTAGKARRMGLITTNSLRQTFNRRVVQAAMDKGLGLTLAIPDHPWVDNADGAAVRIAMTVAQQGALAGQLLTVTHESAGEHGEVMVTLAAQTGLIHADLSVGANVVSATTLQANEDLSNRGVQLFGAGFIVTDDEARQLGLGTTPGLEQVIRDYRNGRDLTDTPRGVKVIDAFGLSAEALRTRFPAVYQWLLERVKPERDQNNRATRRERWWLFGETNPKLRKQLAGLPRYIATVETAKHRTFQFLDASILPDNKLIAIALDDAFFLGLLSSQLHGTWALAAGSWLGVGNDPVYVKSRCFETFPFPDDDTGRTPALRQTIAQLAEQIDAHRKRQQAANPGLTLTGMYNVLEALRDGRELTAKEKLIHTQGLVGVLKELHDELDAAVLAAYGLAGVPQADWLQRLVELNARRAEEEQEEQGGRVRWLRPALQNPAQGARALQKEERPTQHPRGLQAEMALETEPKTGISGASANAAQPWPASLPEQVRAVAGVLAAQPGALALPEIEARFKGRGPWKRSLPRILETLEALGRARFENGGWRA